MAEKYIGVFDSGLGGLTVVRRILQERPEENIIFFGDSLNMPYGEKTREELITLALHNTEILERFDLKALVIACNTADSAAGDAVREAAGEPVYGVISAACTEAVRQTENGRIGVIATRATIRSRVYPVTLRRLRKGVQVYTRSCPELVPLIEAGHLGKDDPEIRKVLKKYLPYLIRRDIDTLILGCTHYPLIADQIRALYPRLRLVSSSDVAAEAVLREIPAGTAGIQRYYVSKDPVFFAEKADIFMPEDITVEELK